MDYTNLIKLTTKLGYELAMCGAETFRIEESINRILGSYGVKGEAFAVPNYLMVSLINDEMEPVSQMRRIGFHGNNLDAVEKLSGLSRKICAEVPEPSVAVQWLEDTVRNRAVYSSPVVLLGDFIGAAGFGLFFGCGWLDMILSGLCGIVVGLVNRFMEKLKANPFFTTMAASFLMSLVAYGMGAVGMTRNADSVIIGAMMLLVPGLLFTNAMRDIIYGDTNSGVTRIVQVLLIAVATSLGTAVAWNVFRSLGVDPAGSGPIHYSLWITSLGAFIGCVGFSIIFNIHGPGGLLCALGGVLAWVVYDIALHLGCSDLMGYFWGAVVASGYAEAMARIRKYPAISYLVVSIFPLIPGSGVYYSMNYAFRGDLAMFEQSGWHTAAIAGVMAMGILMVSTLVRMYTTWKHQRKYRLS